MSKIVRTHAQGEYAIFVAGCNFTTMLPEENPTKMKKKPQLTVMMLE